MTHSNRAGRAVNPIRQEKGRTDVGTEFRVRDAIEVRGEGESER
jgi:hypothetical protein